MRYITTFRNVDQGKIELVGRRALDLAILHEKNTTIPLSFIINSVAMKEFIAENNLTMTSDSETACMQGKMSKEMEEELLESYESLCADEASLVMTKDSADILLIPSPTEGGDAFDVAISLKGKKEFLEKVKSVWASLFSSGHLNAGVVVQRMLQEDISGIAYAGEEENITVKAFFGLQTFAERECDSFEISKSFLSVISSEIIHQNTKLVREEAGIVEYPLKEYGSRQKATDKEVIEIARIAKRCSSYLKADLRIFFGYKKQRLYLLFCDETAASEKAPAEAEITIELGDSIKPFEQPKEPLSEPLSGTARPPAVQTVDSPIEYVKELDKPFMENNTDDFILTIPGSQLMEEPIRKEEPKEPLHLLKSSRQELHSILLHAESAIVAALSDGLSEQGLTTNDTSIPGLVSALKAKIPVPIEPDILKVALLKRKFDENPEAVTLEDLMFSIDAAERFVEVFP